MAVMNCTRTAWQVSGLDRPFEWPSSSINLRLQKVPMCRCNVHEAIRPVFILAAGCRRLLAADLVPILIRRQP